MRTLNEILSEMKTLCDELESHIGQKKVDGINLSPTSDDYSITLSGNYDHQYYDSMTMAPISGSIAAADTIDISNDKDFRVWK